MSWLISAKQYIPAVIGEAWGGGYFAGYISHTQDGNPTHALIVAPRATGATGTGYTLTTNLAWKTATTATAGTTSLFDGAANTAAMVTAGISDHPAANFCKNLSIGGFVDWYLPAALEYDVAYFNLKPSVANNNTSQGVNVYAVPSRNANYTALYPPQTGISAFASGGAEAFAAGVHWSSSESISVNANAVRVSMNDRSVVEFGKTLTYSIRAFRRIAL